MDVTQEAEIKAFVAERDAMLRALDLTTYRAFCIEHGLGEAPLDQIACAAMHKARLVATSFTEDEKRVSREWLLANGFKAEFFGVPQ